MNFQSLKDVIFMKKGCRPLYVQTPSVYGINGICMGYKCRLMNRKFTAFKSYNLELLGIKNREIIIKMG